MDVFTFYPPKPKSSRTQFEGAGKPPPLRFRRDFARFGAMRAAMQVLERTAILLVVGGGIAAYKVLELIRR